MRSTPTDTDTDTSLSTALINVGEPAPSVEGAPSFQPIPVATGSVPADQTSPGPPHACTASAITSDVAIAVATDGLGSVAALRKAEKALEAADHSIVAYDSRFAAQQLLGESPVTPKGRVITAHAAERMVAPPDGRAKMTVAEVDHVLDSGDRIKKLTHHRDGDTITIQSTTMPGKPQVVVDAATGKRVITVIRNGK